MKIYKNKLIILLFLYMSFPVQSDDYNHIATDIFWTQLYDTGGWSLYCGYRFDLEGNSPDGFNIGIDHVYHTEWMMDHLQCRNRTQCYTQEQERFSIMESDLHNLYPVWTDLTVYRTGRMFGLVDGEDWRFDNCDFEWKSGVVEPRPLSRGNIARAIFYMHTQYNVPVPAEMIEKLIEWNRQDIPSEQEKLRNDRIESLQGRRNPYIDNPELIDSQRIFK